MATQQSQVRVVLTVLDQSTATLRRASSEFARLGSTVQASLGGAARAGLSAFGGAARLALGTVRTLTTATLALGAATAYAGARFTQGAVTMAAAREAQEAGLRSIVGSSQAATAALSELQRVAKLPGIGFEQALGAFNQMVAVGTDAKLAIDLIAEFGNAVSLAGGGPEQLEMALRGVSQMMGKGAVSAEELNQQILEQAPIVRRAIQAAWGTADPEVITKRLAATGTSVQEFWRRTLAEMRKLPRAGNGAQNALDNLKIAFDELKIAFGKGFMGPDFSARIDQLSAWLDQMAPQARELGARLREMVDRVVARLPALLAQLREIWGELARGDWQALGARLGGLVEAVMAAVRPRLAQVGTWLRTTFVQAIDGVIAGLSQRFPLVGQVFKTIQGYVEAALPAVRAFVQGVVGALHELGPALPAIGAAIAEVTQAVLRALPAMIPAFEALARAIASIPWDQVAQGLADLIGRVGEFLAAHPNLVASLLGIALVAKPLSGVFSVVAAGLGAVSSVVQLGIGLWGKLAGGAAAAGEATAAAGAATTAAAGETAAAATATGTALAGVGATVATVAGIIVASVAAIYYGIKDLVAIIQTLQALGQKRATDRGTRSMMAESGISAADQKAVMKDQLSPLEAIRRAKAAGTYRSPVRAMAAGGVVTRPTLALVGEAGPEAVVPLRRFTFVPPRATEPVAPRPLAGGATLNFELGPATLAALSGRDRQGLERHLNQWMRECAAG